MRAARVHGGALDAAIARFGGARQDWLDLSTGIAPGHPALPPILPDAWTRLPERGAEDVLREAARGFFGAPQGARIVIAPGTQSLISLWPHLFAPRVAAVVSPTYGEHEAALLQAGHDVARIAAPSALPEDARLLVVVNPNNPDGRRFARAELLDLADILARRGGLLVVDEAFMDADPTDSLGGEAGRPGLLVLRSFGKFFGLAGLRLGFALARPDLASHLERRLGPWPVSGPALAIGTALMGNRDLVRAQRARLGEQNGRLTEVLRRAGLDLVGSTPLFALAAHERAAGLFDALARRHILTRPFADEATWLRFGNPGNGEQAGRLATALEASLAEIAGTTA